MTNNLSLNKESLQLNIGKTYILIDALYLNEIKVEKSRINSNNFLQEIRDEIFPYTDTPFAEYKANESIFEIRMIMKVDYKDVVLGNKSFFSTDTGLIALIDEKLLLDFLDFYDYDELVDSLDKPINVEYWKKLHAQYGQDIGLLLSPGINSGFDFDGSGTYKVVM